MFYVFSRKSDFLGRFFSLIPLPFRDNRDNRDYVYIGLLGLAQDKEFNRPKIRTLTGNRGNK